MTAMMCHSCNRSFEESDEVYEARRKVDVECDDCIEQRVDRLLNSPDSVLLMIQAYHDCYNQRSLNEHTKRVSANDRDYA